MPQYNIISFILIKKMSSNSFILHSQQTITLTEIFNQEHASLIIQQKVSQKPNFTTLVLKNVGVKIMKDALQKFTQHPIYYVNLSYDWNYIMMMPKLVCYDKNTWKTLQQLANWNREWALVFRNCWALEVFKADIVCSWADQEWLKAFLESLTALPNLKDVWISIKSKNQKVGEMLQAFKKAKIFPKFDCQFTKFV